MSEPARRGLPTEAAAEYGRPVRIASFKMAGAALIPFGKEIVSLRGLAQPPPGAVVVPESRRRLGDRTATCHSQVVTGTRIFGVSLVSKDPSHGVDDFYKHRAERLPATGEIIDVVRFVRGRTIRARVTGVHADLTPPITATQID